MGIWSDLKYSARSLARAPGLALALLLTIAVGIGSNAAVAGFTRGMVTRDLPLAGRDRLVSLFARAAGDTFGPISFERYQALRSGPGSGVFETIGAARESQGTAAIDGRTLILPIAAITPTLAGILQIDTTHGVVVSDRIWRSEFRARPDLQGTPIEVEGVTTTVAGVAPEWLEGLYIGQVSGVWVNLPDQPSHTSDRTSRSYWVIGRLRAGVSIDEAQAAVDATLPAGDALVVQRYTGVTPELAAGMSRTGRLLGAAALAVFLIACANVAAFLLSRASVRSQETAVRVAIGASRARIGRQLGADSVLIAIAGGAAGVIVSLWTAQVIPALFFDRDAAHLVFVPDLRAIVIAVVVCGAITIACGLTPLIEIRDDDPAMVLRRESGGPSNATRRIRAGLVIAQMTCCCLLVIATGLLLDGFRSALRTTAGNRVGEPILATVKAQRGFSRPDLGLQFFRDVEVGLSTLPGVAATAWAGTLPGASPTWKGLRVEPPDLPVRDVEMDVAAFTPASLDQVIVPAVEGRMFGGGDTKTSRRVAIVNQAAAAQIFDGVTLGRRIKDPSGQSVEIVGVVATRRVRPGPAADRPTIYYYAEQARPPLDRLGPGRFRVPVLPDAASTVLALNVVSAAYFASMDLTPIAGQLFRDGLDPDQVRVGVINKQAADMYFGGHAVGGAVVDAVGRRTEIVGVVLAPPLRTSQRRPEPEIYVPMSQEFQPRMTLILGARGADEAMLASVRLRLSGVPGGDTVSVTTLDEHLSRTVLAPQRIATTLIGALATTALLLGVLGVYGAMSDAARQRRREIALRIALGAQGWRVIREVLTDGARLAALGTLAGLAGSVLLVWWLARVAPNAEVPAAWSWLAAPLVILVAVVVASVLPARRALAVDPLTIMREP